MVFEILSKIQAGVSVGASAGRGDSSESRGLKDFADYGDLLKRKISRARHL